MKREKNTILPSLRVNEKLARKINLIVKKEGFTSKAEFMRKALELYALQFFEEKEKPKDAEELLNLVFRRYGKIPKIKKQPREVFKEVYKEEGIL